MMKVKGKTFDIGMGGLITYYECSNCGLISKNKNLDCPRCRKEITEHHREEGVAGIL